MTDDGVTTGDEPVDDAEQMVDVGRMKTGGRLFSDVDIAGLNPLGGELEALRFPGRVIVDYCAGKLA